MESYQFTDLKKETINIVPKYFGGFKMEQNNILEETKKKKWQFILYLKALACILITNSHCRNIYPLFFLAVGGGHGNAIFFVLSGFCLATINTPFIVWMKRRVRRIIPPLISAIIMSLFIIRIEQINITGLCKYFIWVVNQYWFVFAILIFYPFYYVVFKKFSLKKMMYVYGGILIIYMYAYCFVLDTKQFVIEREGFSPIKVFFYFSIFLTGGVIQKRLCLVKKIRNPIRTRNIVFMIIIVSGIIWASVYGLITIFNIGLNLQFLIHVSIFIFSVCILEFAIIEESIIGFRTSLSRKLKTIVSIIADSTLEIYLVQVTFGKIIEKINFPFSLLIFLVVAFAGGIFLNRTIKKIENIIFIQKERK